MFDFFRRRQNRPNETPEEGLSWGHVQPALEAVSQVMICESWDELLAVFVRYAQELKSPIAAKWVRGMREAFRGDVYTSVLIEQRAGLIDLHRKKGIIAILRHSEMTLSEPTSTLRLMSRISQLKSLAEVKATGLDPTRFFIDL